MYSESSFAFVPTLKIFSRICLSSCMTFSFKRLELSGNIGVVNGDRLFFDDVHEAAMDVEDVVEGTETPYPEWYKEPNMDDALEHNWFSEMVNAEQDPVTFDDLMGTVDLTKFVKHYLKKDKIMKSDLEGPVFA
ncbi:hypothetical protein Tco_0944576 [Tanacetum coccineum]